MPPKVKAKAKGRGAAPSRSSREAPGRGQGRGGAAAAPASSAQAAIDGSDGGGDSGAFKVNDAPPLNGAVVVITGELDGLTRDAAEDKIKAAGAKVMSSVSGNTTYLVVGSHLDDGRPVEDTSKYKKYMDLKAKGKKHPQLLDEAALLELLGESRGSGGADGSSSSAQKALSVAATAAAAAAAAAAATGGGSPASASLESWVDRHRPKKLEELLGNASAVKKLSEWLRDWDDVVLRGRSKAPRFKPGGGMPENVNARAALVSGPPGIGKSTAARLVAELHGGYNVLEFNASDVRGQKIINSMAQGIADNRTLDFDKASGAGGAPAGGRALLGDASVPALVRRVVIIMDEVDGMGAGDRGGNAALIRMIKKTRNPIICVCNDHSSPKVRSLAFSCYDIRFSRPSKATIAQRTAMIAGAEGLAVEENALESLAESCGNDVRHTLNQLQAMSKSPEYAGPSSCVSYTDMRERIKSTAKDGSIMLSPFDACKNLLTASVVQKMSISERLDHFFVDHSLVHLLAQRVRRGQTTVSSGPVWTRTRTRTEVRGGEKAVHENYLSSVARKPVDAALLDSCARAASLVALGDCLNYKISFHQEWSLLPNMGLMSTVYPAHLVNGFVPFPEFPKFLGNYSKMSRARRLCQELHTLIRLSSSVRRSRLVSSNFAEVLHARVVGPLLDDDVEGAVGVLDAYGLQRDHVAEHLTELREHMGMEEDGFKLVDPKIKAAMTRELNHGSGHAVRVALPASKKRKAAGPPPGDELAEGVDEEKDKAAAPAEGDEESDAEGTALTSLVKVRKAAGKAKAKAKAKAKEESEVKRPRLSGSAAKAVTPAAAAAKPAEAKDKRAAPTAPAAKARGPAATAATSSSASKGNDAKAKVTAKATAGASAKGNDAKAKVTAKAKAGAGAKAKAKGAPKPKAKGKGR